MKSYAKINLALNVLDHCKPKELHTLDMLNVNVSLHDTIKIKFKKDNDHFIKIICKGKNVPLDKNNLIYQVITKFKQRFHLEFSCFVYLNKRIPLYAGLGGGSSNAAATLKILNQHFKTNMNEKQMISFIHEITSDGCYFILNGLARVLQTGDKIVPVQARFKYKILLIKPKFGCSSKEIYANLNYQTIPHPNIFKLIEGIKKNDEQLILKNIKNSLIQSAISLNPDLKELYNRLKACGFNAVCMSGSGSTMFAIANSSYPFKNIKKIINKKEYELFKIVKCL